MGWDGEEPKAEIPEPEKATVEKVEPPKEEPKVAEPPKEAAPTDEVTQPEEMVPQKLIGKIARSIREKSRSQIDEASRKIAALEEENRKLRDGSPQTTDESPEDQQRKVARMEAERIFMERQDAYGRQKYGQNYDDAILLIQSRNDPLLYRKIWGAASPADTLMEEAYKIVEEIQLGPDPKEREQKKLQALKAQWRSEWEAEVGDKLTARRNQPTDVQKVRAAGGDARPEFRPSSWSTSLPK